MRSTAMWRRSVTAAGVYVSAAVGVLGTVIAAHELSLRAFGLLAIVTGTTSVFQLIGDVTVDEALIKYGTRYATRERWGRFRRIFEIGLLLKVAGGVVGGVGVLIVVPFAAALFKDSHGIAVPLALAALIPLVQAPEGVAASMLIVRRRYDVRALFLLLSMLLRLAGLAAGASISLTGAVVGLVLAQALATVAICIAALLAYMRTPRVASEPLADDRREFRSFVMQSSIGSLISPLRGTLAFPLLGLVASPVQVGYFRAAQAPQTAFASLSAPLRMVLIAEQTHEFERGNVRAMYRLLRRYIIGTTAAMLMLVPLLWWAAPHVVRWVFPKQYPGAVDATRLILLAAALAVIWAWTKWFPIAIGKPGLRIWTQSVEIVVLIPTLLVLGSAYGATGAAGATVISAGVAAVLWTVILFRLRREHLAPRREPEILDVQAEAVEWR
jgi:O-antigen/teichoic acid export membrane protein